MTETRTALDFAEILRYTSDVLYPRTEKIVLVTDNLNTHSPASLYKAFAPKEARRLSERFEWHYTPKARYRTTLVKIATPEFYTFYNGEKEQPLERVLYLSDAFMNPAGENSVELKVKVININSDKAHELLEKCGILKEYSQII